MGITVIIRNDTESLSTALCTHLAWFVPKQEFLVPQVDRHRPDVLTADTGHYLRGLVAHPLGFLHLTVEMVENLRGFLVKEQAWVRFKPGIWHKKISKCHTRGVQGYNSYVQIMKLIRWLKDVIFA